MKLFKPFPCFLDSILICICFLSLPISHGHSQEQLSVHQEIDRYMQDMIERYGIPGASLAVVKDGAVIHQQYYGWSSIEHQLPVAGHTLFRLHSLTKIFASVAVFQLIEQGKLSLEDSIGQYLSDLPHNWQGIQIRHLLTHSSGLPDIAHVMAKSEEESIQTVYQAKIAFPAGERFWYNQSNYWLLNRIISQIESVPFEEVVYQGQFPSGSGSAIFAGNNSSIVPHRSTEYEPNEAGDLIISQHQVPAYMYGAGGLSLSLPAFLEWNEAFHQQHLLRAETIDQMWSLFHYSAGGKAPYGWGRYQSNGYPSYGFTGGWRVGFRTFPQNDLSIILLTNGYVHSFKVDERIDYIAGLVDDALLLPQAILTEQLQASFLNQELSVARSEYEEVKRNYPESKLESVINSLGYSLASRGRIEDAIQLFIINTEDHPSSWNVWDSLAEGYEMQGNTDRAIFYYQQSLALNPDNVHAKERIAFLGK
ncbi:MAG: serine hydrolase [Bacteroidota bacterium]